MGEKRRVDQNSGFQYENKQTDYQKWAPVFQHLGLKPRRFVSEPEAAYVCSAEGWFRLSLCMHQKEELNWLRSILEYLEERSFKNWAVAWQQTVIWEESNCCYLIQPWYFSREKFQPGDPATISRIAEILAEFYKCGKDYRENRGLGVFRDRWSTVATGWQEQLLMLQNFKEEFCHEKMRKEINGMRKEAETLLTDCLTSWEAGMNSLFDHHYHLGVLGHGELLAKYIVWRERDYFLLNWEHISFQPKIVDLASLINDVAVWEPEWIVYFIDQYTKLQPLWPEEYQALKAMLQYPKQLIQLFQNASEKEVDHKLWKEVDKELKRKGRCLDKVWRELSSDQTRWVWGKGYAAPKHREPGRISMVLSPAESWGSLSANQSDSLIHVKSEEKLPSDIWHRLVNHEQDRVFGGREGGIMEAASDIQPSELEIAEEPVRTAVEELEQSNSEVVSASPKEDNPMHSVSGLAQVSSGSMDLELTPEVALPRTEVETAGVLNWSGFPKPTKRGKGQ